MTASQAKKERATVSIGLALEAGQLKLILLAVLLLVMVLSSALGVIYSSYKSRQRFAELQQLNRTSIHLEEDWGRLLLEQSTWASPSRIERVAKSQLHMVVPDSSDIIVVEP